MEGIEKITARIIEDAEREIAAMQQETEEEVNTLLAQAQTEAEQESMELLIRGRRIPTVEAERQTVSTAKQVMRSFGWKGRLAVTVAGLFLVLLLVTVIRRRRKHKTDR